MDRIQQQEQQEPQLQQQEQQQEEEEQQQQDVAGGGQALRGQGKGTTDTTSVNDRGTDTTAAAPRLKADPPPDPIASRFLRQVTQQFIRGDTTMKQLYFPDTTAILRTTTASPASKKQSYPNPGSISEDVNNIHNDMDEYDGRDDDHYGTLIEDELRALVRRQTPRLLTSTTSNYTTNHAFMGGATTAAVMPQQQGGGAEDNDVGNGNNNAENDGEGDGVPFVGTISGIFSSLIRTGRLDREQEQLLRNIVIAATRAGDAGIASTASRILHQATVATATIHAAAAAASAAAAQQQQQQDEGEAQPQQFQQQLQEQHVQPQEERQQVEQEQELNQEDPDKHSMNGNDGSAAAANAGSTAASSNVAVSTSADAGTNATTAASESASALAPDGNGEGHGAVASMPNAAAASGSGERSSTELQETPNRTTESTATNTSTSGTTNAIVGSSAARSQNLDYGYYKDDAVDAFQEFWDVLYTLYTATTIAIPPANTNGSNSNDGRIDAASSSSSSQNEESALAASHEHEQRPDRNLCHCINTSIESVVTPTNVFSLLLEVNDNSDWRKLERLFVKYMCSMPHLRHLELHDTREAENDFSDLMEDVLFPICAALKGTTMTRLEKLVVDINVSVFDFVSAHILLNSLLDDTSHNTDNEQQAMNNHRNNMINNDLLNQEQQQQQQQQQQVLPPPPAAALLPPPPGENDDENMAEADDTEAETETNTDAVSRTSEYVVSDCFRSMVNLRELVIPCLFCDIEEGWSPFLRALAGLPHLRKLHLGRYVTGSNNSGDVENPMLPLIPIQIPPLLPMPPQPLEGGANDDNDHVHPGGVGGGHVQGLLGDHHGNVINQQPAILLGNLFAGAAPFFMQNVDNGEGFMRNVDNGDGDNDDNNDEDEAVGDDDDDDFLDDEEGDEVRPGPGAGLHPRLQLHIPQLPRHQSEPACDVESLLALVQNPSLRELKLANFGLTDRHIEAIGEALLSRDHDETEVKDNNNTKKHGAAVNINPNASIEGNRTTKGTNSQNTTRNGSALTHLCLNECVNVTTNGLRTLYSLLSSTSHCTLRSFMMDFPYDMQIVPTQLSCVLMKVLDHTRVEDTQIVSKISNICALNCAGRENIIHNANATKSQWIRLLEIATEQMDDLDAIYHLVLLKPNFCCRHAPPSATTATIDGQLRACDRKLDSLSSRRRPHEEDEVQVAPPKHQKR